MTIRLCKFRLCKWPKHIRTSMSMLASSVICFFANAGAAHCETYRVDLQRNEIISGVSVPFSGYVDYDIAFQTCTPAPFRLVAYLDGLSQQLAPIVRSAGVERNEECGNKLSIGGAWIAAEGGQLHVKVDGHVGRQECVKTKVPEFKGLKITMKNRVVASNTFETNASVEAWFVPTLHNNSLAMERKSVNLNVSNDIYRNLLDLFDGDDRIKSKISESIDGALRDPKAALKLPESLAGFELAFDTVSAEAVDGKPALVLIGTTTRKQTLFASFLGYLGTATGRPAPDLPSCQ